MTLSAAQLSCTSINTWQWKTITVGAGITFPQQCVWQHDIFYKRVPTIAIRAFTGRTQWLMSEQLPQSICSAIHTAITCHCPSVSQIHVAFTAVASALHYERSCARKNCIGQRHASVRRDMIKPGGSRWLECLQEGLWDIHLRKCSR